MLLSIPAQIQSIANPNAAQLSIRSALVRYDINRKMDQIVGTIVGTTAMA